MILYHPHIIQSMRFETHVSDEYVANSFADKLQALDCESMLDKVLHKYDQITGRIRIESLELDIGNVDLDDLELIQEKIRMQFEELLNTRIGQHVFPNSQPSDGRIHHDIEADELEHLITMLLHYLMTGSIPWNISNSPDMESLLIEIIGKDSLQLKSRLLPGLRNEYAAKRLATNFRLTTIELLVKKICHWEEFTSVQQLMDVLQDEIPLSEWPREEKEIAGFYIHALHEAYTNQAQFLVVLVRCLRLVLHKFSIPSLQKMLSRIRHIIDSADTNSSLPAYSAFYNHIREAIETKVQSQITPSIHKTPAAILPLQPNVPLTIVIEEVQEPETETSPGYYIDNAGLVILNAALLQKSFDALNWVKEKKITGDLSRHKMILWMDYLVWGEKKPQEYGMVLNKVLAGSHPTEICDITIPLTEDEKEKARDVLTTVINHWSILKNTGIESLRTTFLQRRGRLMESDGGWQLHVASSGFDMLIDSLPWSYSIIKFPWMNQPLFTQWQTKV
ncbi:MAG: contractile injection system tape measure protein [Saprospiraceae bacterium]|nr:contractile injection system tape measure protein [Saprospiraceae bacterium]